MLMKNYSYFVFINNEVELDSMLPFIFLMRNNKFLHFEVFLREQWMNSDYRIKCFSETPNINFLTPESFDRSYRSKIIETFVTFRRVVDNRHIDKFMKSDSLVKLDYIPELTDAHDGIFIDHSNYTKNERFSEIINAGEKNVYIFPHAPGKRKYTDNFSSFNSSKQIHLKKPNHHVIIPSENTGLLSHFSEKSQNNQVILVGDYRYNKKYINFIVRDIEPLLPFNSTKNIFLILSPFMEIQKLRELIRYLLSMGFNIIAKNHPRPEYKLDLHNDLPEENFMMIDGEFNITELTNWADLVISYYSAAAAEAVYRKVPLIHVEYLGNNREINENQKFCDEHMIARSEREFNLLIEDWIGKGNCRKLIVSDEFINDNFTDVKSTDVITELFMDTHM